MLNGLLQVLVTHKQIIAVVVAAAAIASYMLPINSIMASVSHSGNVHQLIAQANSIDAGSGTAHDNSQLNSASNTASVHIHSK